MTITNTAMRERNFLAGMYRDGESADRVVDKLVAVLQGLCEQIEAQRPSDLADLYALTQAATQEINDLEDELMEAGSEIDTIARELLADDFFVVASAYGFGDADIEELIATREW